MLLHWKKGSFQIFAKQNLNKLKLSMAFTLAEVLITLTIIGVVSSIIIPTIKLKCQEAITISKLSKVYAQFDSSFNSAVAQFGPPNVWGLEASYYDKEEKITKTPGGEKFFSLLSSGLKAEKIDMRNETMPSHYMNHTTPNNVAEMSNFRLPDGTIIFHAWIQNKQCNHNTNGKGKNNQFLSSLCGDFKIDLNGKRQPNMLGIDQFSFRISKRGIIPTGLPDDGRALETSCVAKEAAAYNGNGCTAYAITKKKMPWLYGKQPSWSDK